MWERLMKYLFGVKSVDGILASMASNITDLKELIAAKAAEEESLRELARITLVKAEDAHREQARADKVVDNLSKLIGLDAE